LRLKQLDKFIRRNSFVISLCFFCLVSVGLLSARILFTDSMRFVFLYWNLILAIIPAILAYWLVVRIKNHGWFKWQQILLTFGWLAFLPNSFYLITDMVHLRPNYEASLYFDVVMLGSFMLNGFFLGYISIYLVHEELKKRFSADFSLSMVGIIFLLCSFATYLGRFTRWNTWDIILQPAGLLFDVSDRFVNPTQHNETYLSTASLFIVLFSAYLVIWAGIRYLKK
jgi:uncharacterized membrane protein